MKRQSLEKKGFSRDEIVDALKGHRLEIVEADEWRPLAEHVLELIRLSEEGYTGDSCE